MKALWEHVVEKIKSPPQNQQTRKYAFEHLAFELLLFVAWLVTHSYHPPSC